jgi:hypothetical protein
MFESFAEQISGIAGLQSSVLSNTSFLSEIHETLTQPVFEHLAEPMLTQVAGLRSSILDDVNLKAGFEDIVRPVFEDLAEQAARLREEMVPDFNAATASPGAATLALAGIWRHQLLAWAAHPMSRAFFFCLVTYLYFALWSTHPELAAMISGSLWLAVGMLLVYLGNQRR